MLLEFLNYNKFSKNKYYYWYLNLAKKIHTENRVYDSKIHENHHILPNCLGGNNVLPYTFKEHFIAHLLLTKFTKSVDKCKMTFSLHCFFHFDRNRKLGIRTTSIFYENHLKEYIKACKVKEPTKIDETVYKFKHISSGKVFEGTRIDFLKSLSPDDSINKYDVNALIRAYKKEIKWQSKGWSIFYESKDCYSHEVVRLPSKNPEEQKFCEHCGRHIGIRNYSRWHGDNCKSIDELGHKNRTKHIAHLNKK